MPQGLTNAGFVNDRVAELAIRLQGRRTDTIGEWLSVIDALTAG